MIELAGGLDVLGRAGERSRTATWEELERRGPRSRSRCRAATTRSAPRRRRATYAPQLASLGADRVVAVDASAYFSRPGPRLVTGIELLAHILHPDARRGAADERGRGCAAVELQVRAEGLEPPRAKPTSS